MSINLDFDDFEPCERCRAAFEKLRELVYIDHLTGVQNRRAFEDALTREISFAEHTIGTFSVAFFDIDNFKRINDMFGHDIGDLVLKELGALLRQAHRKYDVVARIGGEEFGILFRGEYEHTVAENLERLRLAVKKDVAVRDSGNRIGITVSIGVTSFTLGDTATTLLTRAGKAMRVAKKGGKDRIVSIPINP